LNQLRLHKPHIVAGGDRVVLLQFRLEEHNTQLLYRNSIPLYIKQCL